MASVEMPICRRAVTLFLLFRGHSEEVARAAVPANAMANIKHYRGSCIRADKCEAAHRSRFRQDKHSPADADLFRHAGQVRISAII